MFANSLLARCSVLASSNRRFSLNSFAHKPRRPTRIQRAEASQRRVGKFPRDVARIGNVMEGAKGKGEDDSSMSANSRHGMGGFAGGRRTKINIARRILPGAPNRWLISLVSEQMADMVISARRRTKWDVLRVMC